MNSLDWERDKVEETPEHRRMRHSIQYRKGDFTGHEPNCDFYIWNQPQDCNCIHIRAASSAGDGRAAD